MEHHKFIETWKRIETKPFVIIFIWITLLLLSLVLGTSLRRLNYGFVPDPYIILDEHTNVWHGLSLRKTGIPTAWSILSVYKDDSITMGSGGPLDGLNISVNEVKPTFANFRLFPKPAISVYEFDFGRGLSQTQLVQPYLDHPPFGAVVLSLLVSKNVKTLADVNNADLRRSAMVLAVITQILIFIFAVQITKKPLIGLIASTVYATAPSYLLMSRYALLENVMSPLILTSMILLVLARGRLESKKIDRLFIGLILLAGISGGLTTITKLTGWVFILGNIAILYFWRFKLKYTLTYSIPAFAIGILYFVWGFYLSPKLFTDLLLLQSGRDFIGSINMLVSFFRVSIFNFPLDGWWIGGFIALLMIPNEKKYLPLITSVVTAIFSALAVSGANYPWYLIPLIPFMTIAIAIFFYDLAVKPSFIAILFVFFTFFSSSFYWGYGVFQKIQPFMLYRLLFLLFIGAGVFWALRGKPDKHKKVWYVGVLVFILILFILNCRSMFFILENWGYLPLIYTPGTF